MVFIILEVNPPPPRMSLPTISASPTVASTASTAWRNAAGSGFPNFSSEVLFEDDPEVYIADSGSMSEPGAIAERPGFADLTAVKSGHVYVIDDNLIARPGPQLPDDTAIGGTVGPASITSPIDKCPVFGQRAIVCRCPL